VDECHHVGAVSFDAILKRTKAKYVLGLTATPIRRDGQQPIIFMQCGPIRYTAAKPANAPHDLEVLPRSRFHADRSAARAGIQDVFRHLANDRARTEAIAAEVKRCRTSKGRKVLVLTERTEHLDAIKAALDGLVPAPFVLHGRMSKKQRAALIAELDALPPDAPRVLLATGKLVGEGFDHPPLDTLVLAMPVSWKGTLQQYAGRLHREHASKTDVRIIDFVDTGHPALLRMWDKRQRGSWCCGHRHPISAARPRQQLVDVAQGRVRRALGDGRPLAAGELALEAVEQPVEQLHLPLVHGRPRPALPEARLGQHGVERVLRPSTARCAGVEEPGEPLGDVQLRFWVRSRMS
jgi:superfamily II DNA or RNA helicase